MVIILDRVPLRMLPGSGGASPLASPRWSVLSSPSAVSITDFFKCFTNPVRAGQRQAPFPGQADQLRQVPPLIQEPLALTELVDSLLEPVVSTFAELAARGAALEFGIGSGRIAIPLARRGVRVQGIERSEAMVDEFRRNGGCGVEDYDLAAQIAVSRHGWLIDGELKTFRSSHRYVWPSELDLMAEMAGMRLRQRWSNWQRSPFTSESCSHASIRTKAV